VEWKRYEDFFYSHSNLYFDLGVSTGYEVEVRRRVGIFAYWEILVFSRDGSAWPRAIEGGVSWGEGCRWCR